MSSLASTADKWPVTGWHGKWPALSHNTGKVGGTGGPKILMPELQSTNWDIHTYRDTYTKGIQLRQRHKAYKKPQYRQRLRR